MKGLMFANSLSKVEKINSSVCKHVGCVFSISQFDVYRLASHDHSALCFFDSKSF